MNRTELTEYAEKTTNLVLDKLSKVKNRKAIFGGSDKSELAKGDIMETNYKSMGQFFVDVIKADQSGGYVTDDLRSSQEKTAGYMEEGDLALGG